MAICPASPETPYHLLGHRWPLSMPLQDAARRGGGVVGGFRHATGDQIVPWGSTFRLHGGAAQPRHIPIAMGRYHRSPKHDPRIHDDTMEFPHEHLAR